MKHEDSVEFWRGLSESDPRPEDTKLGNNDTSVYDSGFILNYATKDSEILDLGSGGGLIINKIHDRIKRIVCIEMFEQFSRFIVRSPNVFVVNADLFNYMPEQSESFDIITSFGILQYFNESEASEIYDKYAKYLRPRGKMIIKQQFGVNETVTIQNHSKELGRMYFAQYRTIELEEKMLKAAGLRIVEVVDIYPPEHNKWSNTHYFVIVAEKI